MINNNVKGLKPFIIKFLGLLMGISYLLNPLQEPINKLLHEISHSIESPVHVISHNSTSTSIHKSQEHYDVSYSDHDHMVVDFIDSIFKTSKETNSPEESLFKKIKIDKHISTNQFQIQKQIKVNLRAIFPMFKENSNCGYFEKRIKPPQYFIG